MKSFLLSVGDYINDDEILEIENDFFIEGKINIFVEKEITNVFGDRALKKYSIERKINDDLFNYIEEKIKDIVFKSYNDIDYFNRDIRRDIEKLLEEIERRQNVNSNNKQ